MNILIDIDDTILNTTGWIVNILNREFSDADYSIGDVYRYRDWQETERHRKYADEIWSSENLYDGPIWWNWGARRILEWMVDIGYRTMCVSTPSSGHASSKVRWIKKNEDFFTNGFALTDKKHSVKGDILIDDRKKNIQGFPGTALLMNRPWNECYNVSRNDYVWRVDSWYEVAEFLRQ